ncbi:hypothetical protein J5I95_22825 [Candidatus Poribacteria bacterium]|nr:hypothetical protein [Candidatus Poribacteria bacterium]
MEKRTLGTRVQFPFYLQKAVAGVLLILILCLAFWIRIQGRERLPDGQFTENDAYLYHWQAGIIADQGHLPVRDMHRWLPLGRDNSQLLPLYAYTIAYTHKVFPWIPLYDIQLYAPAFCFILGLGVLILYLGRCYGVFFATIVGVLLATLPGSVERSAIGFGDRDAWCWMFGVLAVTSYLWKEQIEPGWRKYLATAFAGFTVFLGGLSWEPFGIFVLIVLLTEIWKFCTTDTEQHLKTYFLWILMFVPWLYIISPAYHSGYGFSTHLTALMLMPPVAVFALRGMRHLLLHFYEPLLPHARKLAWGLTLLAMTAGIGYLFFQEHTFETTAFAFSESRLMKDMTELADPHIGYWIGRYGTVFMVGSLGMVTAMFYLWKWHGIPLVLALLLFVGTTFFRGAISAWIGETRCDTLFFLSLGLTILGFSIICLQNVRNPLNVQGNRASAIHIERCTLAMLAWFLLWVALSRGGKRYDFFIGIPLAYGTTWLLWHLPTVVLQKLSHLFKHRWITACFTISILVPVLFWNPLGGHATRAVAAAAKWRKPTPEQGGIAQTLNWMKNTLPENAVVAANWSYGSQLNILGGVKTVTDQDTFLPHWIHLYYRHVYCGQSARKALTFLKTHGATHLMLTEWGLTSKALRYSYIGSDEHSDRRFEFTRLILLWDKRLSRIGQTPFQYLKAPDTTSPPDFLTAHLKDGHIAELPYVAFKGGKRYLHKTSNNDNSHGGVILYYDDNMHLSNAYYTPSIGWQSLSVRLYFFHDLPDIFVPIYSAKGDDIASVKVWEIHYPLDIKTDEKYLVTQPKMTDKQ